MMLDASLEGRLGRETFISSSGSRRRLAFLGRTQTLPKLKKDLKTESTGKGRDPLHIHSPKVIGEGTDQRRCLREAENPRLFGWRRLAGFGAGAGQDAWLTDNNPVTKSECRWTNFTVAAV